MGFLYGQCERLFVTELRNILPDKFLKEFFERLSLRWQFASITS